MATKNKSRGDYDVITLRENIVETNSQRAWAQGHSIKTRLKDSVAHL